MCSCVCMSRRINVVLSEEMHRELIRHVTRGERSRVLEEALRQYLGRRKRLADSQALVSLGDHRLTERRRHPARSRR